MNKELRQHLKRVTPDICAGGVTLSTGEIINYLDRADYIAVARVEGVIRAHAEARRSLVSPHRWTVSCAVECDWQGRGLGRQVLSEALSYCDEHGAEYVDGNAWASNKKVLKLDYSLGFVPVCTVPDVYRRDGKSYDQVVLVRGKVR